MPVCQQNISLEKASILFNMAALYSQIGTRSDRQTTEGLEEAISSFQKAAGMVMVFNFFKPCSFVRAFGSVMPTTFQLPAVHLHVIKKPLWALTCYYENIAHVL